MAGDQFAELRKANDMLVWQIGDVGLPCKRQQVMGTNAMDIDIPKQNEPALFVGIDIL